MKHDSISISSWLHSVATFCALTFKKYPIELTAIIQYVINQLKNRKSYDLLILQEIVQKMCGIEVLSEVNDLQLEAMAGGDLLRQEAGYFNPIRNIKKCANRLKEALADHGLILPLCILLSQHRDYTVFLDQVEREQHTSVNQLEKRHLKLTGSLYDQCQDSLVQFSQFLSTTLTTEEYIEIFPKIDELVNEYHVSADVAFFLSRPMYAHHINSKFDELRKLDRMIKSGDKPSKTQRYLESIDVVMQPVIDLVKTLHPPKIWEDMSPLFYTTFWTLSMNDCYVPTNAYEKQRQSLKSKLNALDDNTELSKAKQRKEKEKILIMLEKLTEEENKQKDHVQHVKARFEKEKEFWFPQKSKTKNETITVFLQLCIFSRCLFTQIDAFYCAKFIQIIHSLKTPNFSTIICYDRIFSDISYSIASLTDNEARRYGRFLLGLLETVMNWHSDSAIFDIECAQFPGFLTVFRNALNTTNSSSTTTSSNKQEQLDYENFRHVCHKWHYKLTKSFIVCLESEEYLQMRNSLIILTKILPYYPRLTGFCSALEKRVEKITQVEKDKKQDIHTLAVGYLGQLKMRKSQMVDEAKFHLKEQSSTTSSFSTNKASTTTDSSSKSNSSSQKTSTTTNTATTSDKFKQPQVPTNKTTSTSSNTNSQQNSSNFATKQISAVLQQASSSTSKITNGQTSNPVQSSSSSSSSSTPLTTANPNPTSTTSVSSSSASTKQTSQNLNGSKTVSSLPPSSSSNASSSSASNGKESSSSNRGSTTSSTTAPNSSSTTLQNSPPSQSQSYSKSRNDENTSIKTEKLSSNGNKTSSSSSKRTSQSSPTSTSLPIANNNLTPTRKLNDYSPTSSVSSDELLSPKRANSQTSNQRHKSHSRSSSPKTQQQQSNGNSHYSSKSSSSHDKNKRLKTDDSNGNGSSKVEIAKNLLKICI
jgi:THO complex subunit 2